MKCALTTLGCKVNQCETDALAEAMRAQGYEIVPFEEEADVVIVNTCCVTAEGERKSRQIVRRAAKISPRAKIVVTGCAAQRAPEMFSSLPQVALVTGNAQKRDIPRLLARAYASENEYDQASGGSDKLPEAQTERTRAFLKIQDGCDHFCTYCVIPYVRGRECSCLPDAIEAQAARLALNGFKEIVLTGIRLSAYGRDRGGTPSLTDVVCRLSRIPGIARVRLGSLEPDALTDEILDKLFALPTFCRHFHLSLQSGCDGVLRRMHRRYTAADALAVAEKIRARDPLCALTADIIVGFPGETEDEFEQTLALVQKIGFAFVHVFPYSERAGTAAAVMPDQVPKAVRHARAGRLSALCEACGKAFRAQFLGQIVSVLVETSSGGQCRGLCTQYLPVSFAGDFCENEIVPVRVTGVSEEGFWGERID